jgi:hypothetical protein
MHRTFCTVALAALVATLSLGFVSSASATIYYVDVNGSTPYQTITAGLAAAGLGDTVKVLPGEYAEPITLDQSKVLIGSGAWTNCWYGGTVITSGANPTVTINSGTMMWFTITSTGGTGVAVNNGRLTNCIITGCTGSGVYANGGTVTNCVSCKNAYDNYAINNAVSNTIYNCIAQTPGSGHNDYARAGGGGYAPVTYCCGQSWNYVQCDAGTHSVCSCTPNFTQACCDFHIGSDSPCWNAGAPGYPDPDGSPGDMGYFGGPYAPVFPEVTFIELVPQGSGGVLLRATGNAMW